MPQYIMGGSRKGRQAFGASGDEIIGRFFWIRRLNVFIGANSSCTEQNNEIPFSN